MIIIHVTTYIFVLLLFLLNRLFVVKVWVLYYFYTTAKILGSYYGIAQSSSSVHILFRLSYFCSSFQKQEHLVPDEYPFVDLLFHVLRGN